MWLIARPSAGFERTAALAAYSNAVRQFMIEHGIPAGVLAVMKKDPAEKKDYLTKALQTYEELLKGLKENDSETASYQRLIALTQIELGDQANLQKAHETLNDLFAAGKFGGPMIRLDAAAESKMNDIFWEGLLQLL